MDYGFHTVASLKATRATSVLKKLTSKIAALEKGNMTHDVLTLLTDAKGVAAMVERAKTLSEALRAKQFDLHAVEAILPACAAFGVHNTVYMHAFGMAFDAASAEILAGSMTIDSFTTLARRAELAPLLDSLGDTLEVGSESCDLPVSLNYMLTNQLATHAVSWLWY